MSKITSHPGCGFMLGNRTYYPKMLNKKNVSKEDMLKQLEDCRSENGVVGEVHYCEMQNLHGMILVCEEGAE